METNNNSDEQNEMEPQEQEQQTAAAVKQDVTEPSEVPTMLHAQQQQSENQDSERREPYANYDDTLAQKSGTQTRVKEEPRDDQIVEANTMDIVDNSSTNNESKPNKPNVVCVQESEEENSRSITLELGGDNSLLLTSLQASFPDATGLKYRHLETNTLRNVELTSDGKFVEPADGWSSVKSYVCVFNRGFKRKNDDEEQQFQQPQQAASTTMLEAIEDFDSSIPDPVVHHFLNAAGMQTSDQRIIRLIAIAAQKFIHDIVSDSLQHCKLRGNQGKKKEKRYTLTIEDLSAALSDYGIEVVKQPYFN